MGRATARSPMSREGGECLLGQVWAPVSIAVSGQLLC